MSTTGNFAWVCAVAAAFFTLGAAYFFDKSADEGIARAGERAAEAGERAAEAGERAANAIEQAEALEVETAKANERAERLRRENLALAEAVSPRSIEFLGTVDALKPFAGTKYFVISASDLEPRATAAQIRSVLKHAGWIKLQNLPEDLRKMPVVPFWPVALEYSVEARDKETPTWKAIGALRQQLDRSGVQSKASHSDTPSGWPADAIRIVVGLKPSNVLDKGRGVWNSTDYDDWEE